VEKGNEGQENRGFQFVAAAVNNVDITSRGRFNGSDPLFSYNHFVNIITSSIISQFRTKRN